MSFTETLTVNQERKIKGDQNYQAEVCFVFDYTFLPVHVYYPRKKTTQGNISCWVKILLESQQREVLKVR